MKIPAISFLYILTFSLFSLTLVAQNPSDIMGIWLTQEEEAKIEIYQNTDGETYFGKIIWLKEPNGEDGNPKKDENGKLVLNMINLKNFVFDDGEWIDGTIYDPKSGSTYYCTITLESADKLKVRGSVDPMGWIGKTNYWTRVK